MDNLNQNNDTFIDMEAMFTSLFEGPTYNREELRLQVISITYFTILIHFI